METLNQAKSIISLVTLPVHTHNCRVLYGIGSGNGLTGVIANNLGDNILALYGEIVTQVKILNVIKLPEEAFSPQFCKIPTMTQIQLQHRRKNKSGFWFNKHKEIGKVKYLPSLICLVAAFLVYNGNNKDIYTIVVLKRWLNLCKSLKGIQINCAFHCM